MVENKIPRIPSQKEHETGNTQAHLASMTLLKMSPDVNMNKQCVSHKIQVEHDCTTSGLWTETQQLELLL